MGHGGAQSGIHGSGSLRRSVGLDFDKLAAAVQTERGKRELLERLRSQLEETADE